MISYTDLYANPSFVEALHNRTLSSRKLAAEWGVSKTWVNGQRALIKEEARVEGGAWPVIRQAAPTIVRPLNKQPLNDYGWKVAVILPDPQIGYRKFEDGTMDPFHDEAAMSVALQVIESLDNVHQVVNLGDFLDLPTQGRFAQEAAFANTMQPAIDRGHSFLAQQRCAAPHAELVLIEGNHDRRLQNFVEMNAVASFGLKRANMPEEWPVMSLQNLLRLEELNITYIDSYPSGKHWVNDKLRAIHGTKVRSNGSTAAAYTNDMPHISTVFGHTHRLEIQSRTTWDRMGKIRSMAISPGCLCRVDGAVPSVYGAINAVGKPVEEFENWQQGVAVVHYKDSGEFFVDLVQIDNGMTVYRGIEYRA